MKNNIVKLPNKSRKKRIITFIILILAFIFQALTYFCFAKYSSNVIASVSAKVAKPIIEIEGEEIKKIDKNLLTQTYYFEVKNYDKNGQINEVQMDYYIEILTNYPNIFEFDLYKENKETNQYDKVSLNENITSIFNLDKDVKQIDKYKIYVECTNRNRITIEDYIQIKVNSIQKQEQQKN